MVLRWLWAEALSRAWRHVTRALRAFLKWVDEIHVIGTVSTDISHLSSDDCAFICQIDEHSFVKSTGPCWAKYWGPRRILTSLAAPSWSRFTALDVPGRREENYRGRRQHGWNGNPSPKHSCTWCSTNGSTAGGACFVSSFKPWPTLVTDNDIRANCRKGAVVGMSEKNSEMPKPTSPLISRPQTRGFKGKPAVCRVDVRGRDSPFLEDAVGNVTAIISQTRVQGAIHCEDPVKGGNVGHAGIVVVAAIRQEVFVFARGISKGEESESSRPDVLIQGGVPRLAKLSIQSVVTSWVIVGHGAYKIATQFRCYIPLDSSNVPPKLLHLLLPKEPGTCIVKPDLFLVADDCFCQFRRQSGPGGLTFCCNQYQRASQHGGENRKQGARIDAACPVRLLETVKLERNDDGGNGESQWKGSIHLPSSKPPKSSALCQTQPVSDSTNGLAGSPAGNRRREQVGLASLRILASFIRVQNNEPC
ncbi:hypothetical protein B0J13DRAFT_528753 [Dactylonectria estremocensis]|uniref:Uncharacterized protein n=1 Tax=Dactylonectria estremocensis TaxID=1079267 RepID=A0A9P9E8Q8_9HYPO|nr:hypothetical protein B0J13DRAFT_528753 [Dactylonectria estremocensis]